MIDLASRRTLRGPQIRERLLLAPDAVSLDDGIWWGGNDRGTGTTLTVTGSQTITETAPFSLNPKLSVTAIAGISANDMNCVLFPRTIATGQVWRCRIRLKSVQDKFCMAMLGFTDGVVGTSNVVTSFRYVDTSLSRHIADAWHGTLTNLTTGVSTTVFGVTQGSAGTVFDSTYITEIEYTSANTFAIRWRDESLVLQREFTGVAKTMTPTHIAVGWSNWGEAEASLEVHFGPVYRAA